MPAREPYSRSASKATGANAASAAYARDERFGILIPKNATTTTARPASPATASSGSRPRKVVELAPETLNELSTTLTARVFGIVKDYTTGTGSLRVEVSYFYAIPEARPQSNDATLTVYSLPRGSIVTGVVPLGVREQDGAVPPAGTPVILTLRLVPGKDAGFVEIRSLEVLKPPETRKKG